MEKNDMRTLVKSVASATNGADLLAKPTSTGKEFWQKYDSLFEPIETDEGKTDLQKAIEKNPKGYAVPPGMEAYQPLGQSPRVEYELISMLECAPEVAERIRRKMTRALGEICRNEGLHGVYVGFTAATEANVDLKWVSSLDPLEQVASARALAVLENIQAGNSCSSH